MSKQSLMSPKYAGLAALVLAVAASGSAIAATAVATSTSVVVAPIAIAKATDLSFGSFAASATAGSVTVSPNGSRGVNGGVTGMAGMAGATTAAQFDVTGQADSTYSISVTGTQLSSGTDTMAFTPISDLTASAITSGTVAGGTLTGGAQSIYVGGVLTVASNQAAGTYTGSVSATVEYN